MPINYEAPVSPVDLTTFVRRVPTPANLTLLNLFGTEVRDSNEVAFSEITKVNRTAKFRAPDGRIHVADRDGGSDRVVKMIPLSDSRNQGEYERLQRHMQRLGGTRTEALEQATYDDGQDLTSYVLNRAEMALGDTIADGIFSPAELKGVSIDFGVPANHLINAGTAWSNPSADGLGNLIGACDVYEATNGFRPGFGMTDRATMRNFLKQSSLIAAVKGSAAGVSRVSLQDASGVLENEGIPTEWIINETQLDVDGVSTRTVPTGKVVLGPPNPQDMMTFRFGTTATSMELLDAAEVDFSFSEAPGIVGVTVKEGPPFREFTFVDAIGLPLLKNARLLMVVSA